MENLETFTSSATVTHWKLHSVHDFCGFFLDACCLCFGTWPFPFYKAPTSPVCCAQERPHHSSTESDKSDVLSKVERSLHPCLVKLPEHHNWYISVWGENISSQFSLSHWPIKWFIDFNMTIKLWQVWLAGAHTCSSWQLRYKVLSKWLF